MPARYWLLPLFAVALVGVALVMQVWWTWSGGPAAPPLVTEPRVAELRPRS